MTCHIPGMLGIQGWCLFITRLRSTSERDHTGALWEGLHEAWEVQVCAGKWVGSLVLETGRGPMMAISRGWPHQRHTGQCCLRELGRN